MAKLVLADVASTAASPSTAATINSNSALLEAALENTLSRDGTSPNAMGAHLDMNSNRVYNLPTPTVYHDAATKKYVDDEIDLAIVAASGVADGDPKNTSSLGVNYDNTSGSQAKAVINGNTSTSLPTAPTGTILDVHSADSSNGIISVTSYGAGSILSGRRANGTMASPTAVQADQVLHAINALGYGSTGYSGSRASIHLIATENWSDAAQGAGINFLVTPTGSTTQASELRLTPAALFPTTDAGLVLGTATSSFGALSLSSGATIGFANSNVVLTHSSGVLTVSPGDLRVTTAGTNSASVVTVGGTQTLSNKTIASLVTTGSSTLGGTTTVNGNLTVAGDLVKNTDAGDFAFYGGNAFDAGAGIILSGENNGSRPNRIWFVNNNFTTRLIIDQAGNFAIGNQSALSTSATDGFVYIPTCAGTPTGTPTSFTGLAPLIVNTTNNKLYFYSGGAWRDAGP